MIKVFLKDKLKPHSEDPPFIELNIFYIIDVSQSMEGSKIAAVNDVMPRVLSMLDEIDNKDNAVIKTNVLVFNDNANWIFPLPIYAREMQHNWPVLSASGGTSYGEMCIALESALHRNAKQYIGAQMDISKSHRAPIIILMSDGAPLDTIIWETKLEILNSNGWFQEASKIAVAIGNKCDRGVLQRFVGNDGFIVTVHNIDDLKSTIKIVSSVASIIGTEGRKTTKEQLKKHIIQDPDGIDFFD